MSDIITMANALPRSIDVNVSVTMAQVESSTELTALVFCTPNATLDQGNSRVRFYTTIDAVAEDFASSSEAYKAASAWFSQTPHAKTFAVGRIFTSAVAGFLKCGALGTTTLSAWQAITTGSFAITLNGTKKDVTGVSFAGITALSDIASVLQTAIRAADVTPAFASATVTYIASSNQIKITSGTTGDASTVGYLTAAASGTNISGGGYLNGAWLTDSAVQSAIIVDGYTPGTIADELTLIKSAASQNGTFVYGWAFDAVYRDTNNAVLIAKWVENQDLAIAGIVTNSPAAYDPNSTTDIASVLAASGYKRVFCVYHDNPYYYPEVSILAYALSVNYSSYRSTITTKFKRLEGIPTVSITETELEVLNKKRVNTYTLVGNNSRTFRNGVQTNSAYYIDDLINLDNFKDRLQTAVFNVFLQHKKVAYTVDGVALLQSAMAKVCDQFVYNGAFAARPLSEAEAAIAGFNIDPAYTINITGIGNMSISDRENRIGPPATIKVNLAGAIHSIDIAVEAYA